ncbi:hypothetical protein [Endozoicomonas sp. 8E]|nr:hypothetical protein [Endozoicomonas sp. 8E]WOG26624.1 hypothetical protein P6910_19040 [Endozoicomonas sp. 8E]
MSTAVHNEEEEEKAIHGYVPMGTTDDGTYRSTLSNDAAKTPLDIKV